MLCAAVQSSCRPRGRGLQNKGLEYEDVLRIVELVKSTAFSEFRLKVGEIEVHLRRANGADSPRVGVPQTAPAGSPRAAAPGDAPLPQPAESRLAPDANVVRSPMVGTFYRAPSPGAAPFVEVGQRVEPDTTVCIIEVMKLMNTIAAGARGVLTDIFVADGASVEFDQILIAIRPDGKNA